MGGMVLETNMAEILTHIDAQNKITKQEVRKLLSFFILIMPKVFSISRFTEMLNTYIIKLWCNGYTFSKIQPNPELR